MKKILPVILFCLSVTAWFTPSPLQAQCTATLPAGVNVIRSDSTIDCSFLVTQDFLLCEGAVLNIIGNSTCFNRFFLEQASVIRFNDTLPFVPYGLFSFYVKDLAILDYNRNSPISFYYIDTLVYEPAAILLDTGFAFQFLQACPSIVFDYSLIPGGNPCLSSGAGSGPRAGNFLIYPNPVEDYFEIKYYHNRLARVRVSSITGQVLQDYTAGSPGEKYQLGFAQPGLFIVSVTDDKGMTRHQRLIRH